MVGLGMLHRSKRRTGAGAGPSTLLAFTSPEWAFLLGPQTVVGSYVQTGTANLESNLTSRIDEFVTRCTSLNGFVAETGTVAVTLNSSTLTGTGTTFTGKAGRAIRIPDATMECGYRYFIIVSVSSATSCVIGAYSSAAGDNTAQTWL